MLAQAGATFYSLCSFVGRTRCTVRCFFCSSSRLCLQALWVTGAADVQPSSSADVGWPLVPARWPSTPGAGLTVTFGVHVEKPRVSGTELQRLVFIMLLCSFFGRLAIDPRRSLGFGRGQGDGRAAWRRRAHTVACDGRRDQGTFCVMESTQRRLPGDNPRRQNETGIAFTCQEFIPVDLF